MSDEDFPLFDGHMHFSQAYLDQVIASYTECGVQGGINMWSPDFHDYAEFLRLCKERELDKRFVQFYWPDWRVFGNDPEAFVKRLCEDMRRYAELGARGLKVWKDMGMFNRYADDTPVVMDDARLEPVWKTVQEVKWTIAIHQADPTKSFEQRCNTRFTREELFERRDKVIAAHPEITFILCHSGNDIEDCGKFAALLDRFPNVRADLRPSEIGTPEEYKSFLEKYADRFYLGPDLVMPMERPPDRQWNIEECYQPWRKRLLSYNLSPEAFKKITWANGEQHFLKS
jgi:predicted TIM-barrel fold metal-dependent hydrolase